MSFLSKLFTRKITYIEVFCRDAQYRELIHVFGAIRVMPDEGDSFDIWKHAVIDLNTFAVTNGLQQRGNEFSIKSAFARRCVDHMSTQLNRKLKPVAEEENSDADDEKYFDDNYEETEPEFKNLGQNCELPVVELDQNDTDTAEPKKIPPTGLVFRKYKVGDNERFTVQLHRSGRGLEVHQMRGMCDYFRHVLCFRKLNRVVVTYRKENWMGSGGMAFFVLDANSGQLLHNDLIK